MKILTHGPFLAQSDDTRAVFWDGSHRCWRRVNDLMAQDLGAFSR